MSEPQVVEISGFTVLGLATRTTNEAEMSGAGGRIGPLWQAFMEAGDRRIPGVMDAFSIFAVYTGYETDETGSYDLIVGRNVQPGQDAPEGMRAVAVPSARYMVFEADGNNPEAIKAAWIRVYTYFSKSTEVRRAFTVDFEKYSGPDVNLYIAVG